MAITASDVNKLRQETGAGMMDCKKALEEAGGNFEEAVVILRKKGQKVSANRADRDAREGMVMVRTSEDGTYAQLVALSCETDFVAKNEDYAKFANQIADVAYENRPANIDALKQLTLDGVTVADRLLDYTGKIGEKIEVTRYEQLSGTLVVPYIHSNNKVGVLAAMNQASENSLAAGKDVTMQIAAMRPIALDPNGVDATIVQKEIEIAKDQIMSEGKPAELAEKIAMGKLNKFYKDNTLLEQEFVKDNSVTIAQMLDKTSKGLTVNAFIRVELGA